ncbi:MAG: hypothetical protein ACI8TX_002385 [Hyphomicrobiaceae bacterium]|jgi:hypothetical protein
MPAFGSHKASAEIEIGLILVMPLAAQLDVPEFMRPALGEGHFVMELEAACRAASMRRVVFESATPDISQPNRTAKSCRDGSWARFYRGGSSSFRCVLGCRCVRGRSVNAAFFFSVSASSRSMARLMMAAGSSAAA